MSKRSIHYIITGLVLAALLLAGCGGSAPPETRAGEWEASTDFGEFTLLVDPTGMEIMEIAYSFESCSSAIISGSVTFQGTLARDDGGPIAGIQDGKFELEVSGISTMIFEGKFSSDGTRVSGTWEAGACSGKFSSSR